MKTLHLIIATFLLAAFVLPNQALAAPTMNAIYVQGYMIGTTGSPIDVTGQSVDVTVSDSGGTFWAKNFPSVNIDKGFISLSLSGAGDAPYAANTLAASTLKNRNGAVTATISTVISGQTVTIAVNASSVPLAIMSDTALQVIDGAITASSISINSVGTTKILDANVTDAKLFATGTMPAWSAANMTNIPAANIVGHIPAASISGISLSMPSTNSASFTQSGNFIQSAGTMSGTGTAIFDWSGSSGAFSTSTGTNTLNGNVVIAGTNTFDTGTGAVSLNGNTTVTGANTFTTGTGLVGINGDVMVASGKSISSAGGAAVFDWSGSTGAFRTGSGAVTLNGNTTVSGTNTFGTGTGAVSLNGPTTVTSTNLLQVGGAGVGGGLDIQGGDVVLGNATSNISATGPMQLNGLVNVSGDSTFSGTLVHDSTGATKVAAGTTAQRPGANVAGASRYNSTTGSLEYNNGSGWVGVAGTNGTTQFTGPVQFSGSTMMVSGDITLGAGSALSAASGALGISSDITIEAGKSLSASSGAIAVSSDLSMAPGKQLLIGTSGSVSFPSANISQATAGDHLVIRNNTDGKDITLWVTGSGAVDISNAKIKNLAPGTAVSDAVTYGQFTAGTPQMTGRLYSFNAQTSASAAANLTATTTWPTTPTVAAVGATYAADASAATGTFGPLLQISTSTAAEYTGSVQGGASALNAVMPQWNPTAAFKIASTGVSTNSVNQRLYVGLSNLTTIVAGAGGTCLSGASLTSLAGKGVGGAGTLSAQRVALFRYANGTTSDSNANWQCVTCNTAACTVTDSGVSYATTTGANFFMQVEMGSGTTNFRINGAVVCSHSGANVPSNGTLMYPMVTNCNAVAATARSYKFGGMSLYTP